jgi:nucleoside-diphosphate kinase
MTSAPVVVQVLEGDERRRQVPRGDGRDQPRQRRRGTIRKLFAESVGENTVHGSDSAENARIEIEQFFTPDEIVG